MLIQQTFKGRLIVQAFKLFPYHVGENTSGREIGFQTLKGDYLEQEIKQALHPYCLKDFDTDFDFSNL